MWYLFPSDISLFWYTFSGFSVLLVDKLKHIGEFICILLLVFLNFSIFYISRSYFGISCGVSCLSLVYRLCWHWFNFHELSLLNNSWFYTCCIIHFWSKIQCNSMSGMLSLGFLLCLLWLALRFHWYNFCGICFRVMFLCFGIPFLGFPFYLLTN